jgi:hypothetical protein
MSLSLILNRVITFYQNNLLIALAVTLLLVYFLFRKPIFFLAISLITLFLIGMLYLIPIIDIWK